MDESQTQVELEGGRLFVAEPVLAATPTSGAARRSRVPGRPVGSGPLLPPPQGAAAPLPAPPMAPPVSGAAHAAAAPIGVPPTPAEYFAAEEQRVAQAQRTFDPERAAKGPKVVAGRRRRSRGRWVLGVLGVLAVAAGAGLGAVAFLSGTDDASEPAAPESEVAGSTESAPLDATRQGPFGTIAGVEVRVAGVTDPFGYGAGPAPEGFRYVAVDLRLTNLGEGLVESTELVLVDGGGIEWGLAPAPFEGLGEPVPLLGPGMEVVSTPVFQVADAASSLSLVVRVPGESGELALPLS